MLPMQKDVAEYISQKFQDPIIQRNICKYSGEEFPIFQWDVDLIKKLTPNIAGIEQEFLLSDISPRVRQLIALMYKNERHLYAISSALSGTKTVSRIAPEMWLPVITMQERASDDRDCLEYGLDRAPGQDVIQTIRDLSRRVPYQDLVWSFSNLANNAQYTNYTADLKDCYLLFDSNTTESSAYCTKSRKSSQVFDCLNIKTCEQCYECVDCTGLYECFWLYDCSDCRHSARLIDCHGCNHCIWCTNLHNASYHIYNQQVTPEEYQKFLLSLKNNGWKLDPHKREELKNKVIRKSLHILQSENCLWENIRQSKNVFLSSNILGWEDLRYCFDVWQSQDCYDVMSYGHDSTQMYCSSQVGRFSNHIYCSCTVGRWEYLYYCIDTKKSKNCFWCVNMKQKEYCIFNKQYTKEKYFELVPKIIQQMKQDGQRWSYFDSSLAMYPYNDSVAMDYFAPEYIVTAWGEHKIYDAQGVWTIHLQQDEWFIVDAILDLWGTQTLPIKWRTRAREINVPDSITTIQADDIPSISTVTDTILQQAIICKHTWQAFRIVPTELAFCRKHHLPLPQLHPTARYRDRLSHRPWYQLWLRQCSHSQEALLSVYDDLDVVSDKVYQKIIYW